MTKLAIAMLVCCRLFLYRHKVPSFYLTTTRDIYVQWAKTLLNFYLNRKFVPTPSVVQIVGSDLVRAMTPTPTNTARYTQQEQQIVSRFLGDINRSNKVVEIAKLVSAFKSTVQYAKIDQKAKSISSRYFQTHNIWTILQHIYGYPVGAPDTTTELGYLFIDRTRIRPSGFSLGEHLYSLSLAPGEEVTLEQKSYVKESQTFEETLEHEYKQKLSSESETSTTEQQSTGEEVTDQTTTSFGGNTGVGGSIPIKQTVTVNADVGLDASQSFSNARTVSEKISQETAHKQTDSASSNLRSLHRTQFKVVKETGFESRSQRIIRNPNTATALSLHYFKIMQRLKLKQERKGVCLCWAPFIRDPGASLRVRMELARDQVYKEAEQRLDLPSEPTPPTKDFVRVWISGEVEEILTSPPIGFSNFLSSHRYMSVRIPNGHEFTGKLRVKLDGPTASSSHAVVDSSAVYEGPDEHGNVSVPVLVKCAWNAFPTTLFVTLEAEVRKIPASYDEKHEAYLERLDRWQVDVAEIISRARTDARPKAEAAARLALQQADIRSELLDAVIKQHIAVAQRDEAFEVELWHRLLDFENISFTLYPGWWNEEPMPYPETGPDHILNASWARVYLPVRHLNNTSAGRSNEEKFLHELFKPDRQAGMSNADYNRLVVELIKDLRIEQNKFYDSSGTPIVKEIGKEWEVTVPTDGTHVECVLAKTTAADRITERRIESSVKLIEAEVTDLQADMNIKRRVVDPVSGMVHLGHNGDE